MNKKPCFFILLLISLPLLLLPQTGQSEALENHSPAESALTFGSQEVLDSCWTEAELRGAAMEKKSTFPRPRPAPPPLPPPSYQHLLPSLPPELHNLIHSLTPVKGEKFLALTFDLCEGPGEITGYDGDIVDFLRTEKIKATFFAGGKWLQSHPDRGMQLMADPLFEIGNHSWDHPNFKVLSEPQMLAQILRTQAQYELLWKKLAGKIQARGIPPAEMDKIPKTPLVFRFPYGSHSPEALQLISRLGLPAIQWNIVTADPWKLQTAEKISHLILTKARPGSIVIMHANGKGSQTARALALCVPQLQNQGYQFVTVSELLQAGPLAARQSITN